MTDKNLEPEVNYLLSIINPIASDPNAVNIEHIIDEKGILLNVSANKEDTGLLIGKKGETAKALRRLLRLFGMRNEKRIAIKIIEPGGHGDLKY